MESNKTKPQQTSYWDLRMIGISLFILSLGLAIAYGALIWFSATQNHSLNLRSTSSSGRLK